MISTPAGTSRDHGFCAKLMFVQTDGQVLFAGEKSLVPGPEAEVKWFTDVDEALAQVRDVIHLNVCGITQVRIIGAPP